MDDTKKLSVKNMRISKLGKEIALHQIRGKDLLRTPTWIL